jgi:hypothetical protein
MRSKVVRVEHFPGNPGAVLEDVPCLSFTQRFQEDRFNDIRVSTGNTFYPFSGRKEWGFTHVFMKMSGSLAEKTELLETEMVSSSCR